MERGLHLYLPKTAKGGKQEQGTNNGNVNKALLTARSEARSFGTVRH
jgi:hypothetical protein